VFIEARKLGRSRSSDAKNAAEFRIDDKEGVRGRRVKASDSVLWTTLENERILMDSRSYRPRDRATAVHIQSKSSY